MKRTTITGAAAIAATVAVLLSGCGSDTKTAPTSASNSTSSSASATAAPSSKPKVAPRDQDAKGPNPTIASFIQENNIQETPIKRGDPGSPIIDLAPGELNNLPGWKPMNAGAASTLGVYPAYQLGGTWTQDGQTKIVAQKTVVVPGSDGVYILQLNADGLENQHDIISAATDVIDSQTKITP
ncbi:MAG: LpqN/LpqT family lipoprotein [Mycobacterium sp.]